MTVDDGPHFRGIFGLLIVAIPCFVFAEGRWAPRSASGCGDCAWRVADGGGGCRGAVPYLLWVVDGLPALNTVGIALSLRLEG